MKKLVLVMMSLASVANSNAATKEWYTNLDVDKNCAPVHQIAARFEQNFVALEFLKVMSVNITPEKLQLNIDTDIEDSPIVRNTNEYSKINSIVELQNNKAVLARDNTYNVYGLANLFATAEINNQAVGLIYEMDSQYIYACWENTIIHEIK